jgi:hypothetical protein
VLKSLVPTQSSQDKEKFSCPFQSTDNFPEWKLAFTVSVIPGGQPADISDDAQLIGQHVRGTNCYANQSIENFEDND